MNIALILAGGVGSRMGTKIPKQYIEVKGKPIISYCLDKFTNHSKIDKIHIVADVMWQEYIMRFIDSNKFSGFSSPGSNRQLSIYNGLIDVGKYATAEDIILIHDAARPNVSAEMITTCLEKIESNVCSGVIPVFKMKDTVYYSEDGNSITSLISRDKLLFGQAPEAFRLGDYTLANQRLLPDEILKINGSTEPAVLASMNVEVIAGDENNFKITTNTDFEKFIRIVEKGN